jgi:preprotein translocase subunit SecG
MHTLVVVLHLALCVFLIIVVLLQPGKGGDVSAAFGGGSSQTVFGSRGATTFLQKLTTYAAILFMVTTITLAWFSSSDVSRASVINENVIKELEKKNAKPAGDQKTVKDIAPAADKGVKAPAPGGAAKSPDNVSAGSGDNAADKGTSGDTDKK